LNGKSTVKAHRIDRLRGMELVNANCIFPIG
jgi:hypothetical protein